MTGLKVPTSLKRAVIFISDGEGNQTCIKEEKGKVNRDLRRAVDVVLKTFNKEWAKGRE